RGDERLRVDLRAAAFEAVERHWGALRVRVEGGGWAPRRHDSSPGRDLTCARPLGYRQAPTSHQGEDAMRVAMVLMLGLVLVSGCGKGSGGGSQMTGPTGVQASETAKRVTANLADPFLYDHNAAFNGGRTFRWVTPIPIFVITPEPAVTNVV